MSDLKKAYAKIGASASRMTPNCVTCEWKTKWKATQLMSSISNFAVFLNYLSDGLWSLNEYSYRSEHDLISVLRYARIATQGSLYCIATGLSVSILFIIRDTALAMSLSTRPAIVAGHKTPWHRLFAEHWAVRWKTFPSETNFVNRKQRYVHCRQCYLVLYGAMSMDMAPYNSQQWT